MPAPSSASLPGKALTLLLASAMTSGSGAPSVRVEGIESLPRQARALAARPVGRVEAMAGAPGWRYQWPGTYFEARFSGDVVFIDLGTGEKHARISIDGREVADLLRPRHHQWRVGGLAPGEHAVRVDIVSESRDGAQTFGGFAVPARALARTPPPARTRAIEFVGDSYTVGYGAGSSARTCSDDEVWRTTDNSLAFGPQVARRFDADYRIMAISGRGMVRNFANGPGDTLPAAWRRWLPGEEVSPVATDEAAWSPQLIVIGLGTNDFSTIVGPGEPWRDDAAMTADFESRYVDFVGELHRRHPSARVLLLATDAGAGAAERAIARVRARLAEDGVPVGDVLALGSLALDACDWHPSRADHEAIARRLGAAVTALIPEWQPRGD